MQPTDTPTAKKADPRVIATFVEERFPHASSQEKTGLIKNIMSVLDIDEDEYCPCGRLVTGDYGICSSPQCK